MDDADNSRVEPERQAGQQQHQQPARRRKLAHRRQYAKSPRLASSYLRSQFVKYDTLSRQFDSADAANSFQSRSEDQLERTSIGALSCDDQPRELDPTLARLAHWIKFEQPEAGATRSELSAVHNSSSSLDSYSLNDPNQLDSPLAEVAKSFSHLASWLEPSTSVSQELSVDSTRVVRSETVDLNRILRPTVQSSSNQSARLARRKDLSRSAVKLSSFGEQQTSQQHHYHSVSSERDESSQEVSCWPAELTSNSPAAADTVTILTSRRNFQCIDNVHFNDLFHGSVTDSSSVTLNQSVR